MGARDFTLADVVERCAETYGDNLAFVFGDTEVSHIQHRSRVRRLAAGLSDADVAPGDRIAIVSRNNREFIEFYGAVAAIGAILVPLNWRLADDELAYIIDDSGPRILVADDEQTQRIAKIRDTRKWPIRCFGIGAAGGPFEPVETLYPDDELEVSTEVQGEAPCLILYTAATDGRPKGALISHSGLIAGTQSPLHSWDLSEVEVNLGILPFFHLAGMIMTLATQRAGGATIVFPDFNVSAVLDSARDRGATLLAEFPPMLESLLDASTGDELSALRVVVGLDTPDTISRLERDCPEASFWSVFGQSETSGFVTLSPFGERPGSAGRSTSLNRVRIFDELDRGLPTGSVGEIAVRGPGVFLGYWNLPDETAFTLRNGWHHTGDLGAFDEDGYLWYKGRSPAKELIKSGGENVYPAEVENVIADHSVISEVSVIGVPDKTRGETIKAVCVLHPQGHATEDEIIEFVGERVAHFKRPRYVVFVPSLPKLDDGTIDRGKVKEAHTDA